MMLATTLPAGVRADLSELLAVLKSGLAEARGKIAAWLGSVLAPVGRLLARLTAAAGRGLKIAGWIVALLTLALTYLKTGSFEFAGLKDALTVAAPAEWLQGLLALVPGLAGIEEATIADGLKLLTGGLSETLSTLAQRLGTALGVLPADAEGWPGLKELVAAADMVAQKVPAGLLAVLAGVWAEKRFRAPAQ